HVDVPMAFVQHLAIIEEGLGCRLVLVLLGKLTELFRDRAVIHVAECHQALFHCIVETVASHPAGSDDGDAQLGILGGCGEQGGHSDDLRAGWRTGDDGGPLEKTTTTDAWGVFHDFGWRLVVMTTPIIPIPK